MESNSESKMLKSLMINIMTRLAKQGIQHCWDISKNLGTSLCSISWRSQIANVGNCLSQMITIFGQKAVKNIKPISIINSNEIKFLDPNVIKNELNIVPSKYLY